MTANNNHRSVEPYLFFNGNCEEAVEFYRKALGGEVLMLVRFKDSPEPPQPGMVPPGYENKVMHCSLKVGNTTLMASDGCEAGGPKFNGFSLSLALSSEADAEKAFNALAEGGQVQMTLTKTFWSPKFGMLQDKYGVGWMVNVMAAGQK